MDSLGTEIGQKMRSAVKAKLIELGTGSASGYIDDELPDYVMIMVANKRSRQQMVDDLSLFLGAQTEVFVNWLHQVLQKLQEVTLPASVAAKTMKDSSKKKSSSSDKPRKDKKGKRARETSSERAAALSDDGGDKTPPRPSTATAPLAGGSITEVFANQYIEKAKKTLEVDAGVAPPVKKAAAVAPVASITDIATATVLQKHQKELRELEEIQQRINAAKQHLKSLGTEIPDDDDEDFLLLKANDDDLMPEGKRSKASSSSATGNSSSAATHNQAATKQRQRITMEPTEQPSKAAATSRSTTPPPAPSSTAKDQPSTTPSSTTSPTAASKRPVHERLGNKGSVPATGTQEPASNSSSTKKQTTESTVNSSRSPTKNTIISLSAHRREEREIYVPLFRRKEPSSASVEPSKPRTSRPPDSHSHSHSARGRSRERTARVKTPPLPPPPVTVPSVAARRLSRERRLGPAPPRSVVDVPGRDRDHRPSSRDRRSRSPVRASERRERSKNGCEPAPSTVRSRIGSRVIVLPPKPDYNEDVVEVPVASVIKVQPRPTIPKAKQPSKNLLLKAMAEAQRSTVANVRKRIDNTGAIGGEIGKGGIAPFAPRIIENKPKLLIEIPGGASGRSEVEVEYEDDEMLEDNRRQGEQLEEEELVLRRRQIYRNVEHEEIGEQEETEEEIHEVDIANQVLMEDSDGDDEFRQMLEDGDGGHEQATDHQPSTADTGLEPIDDDDDNEVNNINDDGDGTKFVVTLDGAFKGKDGGGETKPIDDSPGATGPVSPSHTPPPPPATSSGQSTKARLPVKERIGLRRQPSQQQQQPPQRGRQSPTKDNKELEETLKKRKERFREKPVSQPPPSSASPSNDGPLHRSSSPRGQRRSEPKPKAAPPPPPAPASTSPRSSNSTRDRTPSLSPEPPERRDRYTSDYQRQRTTQSRHRSPPSPSSEPVRASVRPSRSSRNAGTGGANNSSPSHLNELLLQRTKELMDESVSSSPIYMSKTDYDRMEPASRKRKRVSPIQFDLTDEDERQESDDDYRERRSSRGRTDERQQQQQQSARGRSRQRGDSEDRERDRDRTTRGSSASRRDLREQRGESRGRLPSPGRKIKKLESSRKFDDIPPLLSAVSVSGGVDGKTGKGGNSVNSSSGSKERCKYFPSCRQGDACEFLHPSTPCKAFPGCKFGDKCLYLHPMCKYDQTCHRLDCNFMHTKGANASGSGVSAPPLASSVVPVQNYKTISAKPLPPLCKYYPHCSNTQCPFYHPKMCRFGRHCVNKVECNFYHYDLPPQELHESSSKDKFRWISPFSA
ncbi:zinc finger CCCH domain-containing protein 14 [Anopheles aquasalis]|uniref:zinc finger CCCH domain-containing protein 14 n=1 Tax=Anopheles aquasalis TaxID=42839 RepID=UPI00215A3A85|nr:zinc finger CCCH domain-containing protein 14 [Anopheles aquasalis]